MSKAPIMGGSLRRTGLASLVALMLVTPVQGAAQALASFEDLGLRVNLDDHLQVEDQSGVEATGRLTKLARDEIAIQTKAGETQSRSSGPLLCRRSHAAPSASGSADDGDGRQGDGLNL